MMDPCPPRIEGASAVAGRDALVARIDAVLPQTQCTKCGQTGCLPYAEAIADGRAQINQCPPGGAAGIAKLASITGHLPLPLNPKLMTGVSSCRPMIAGNAKPGREAQPPWVMDVP